MIASFKQHILKKNSSVASAILKSLIPFVVIISIFLTAILANIFHKKIKTEIQNNLFNLSYTMSQSVENWFKEKIKNFNIAHNEINSTQNESDINLTLTNLVNYGSFYSSFLVTDKGDVFFNDNQRKLPDNIDPRKRPWYIQAKNSTELIITKPYKDLTTGSNVVTLAKAIEGGVIGADLVIDSVVDEITVANEHDLETILLDNSGDIIAYPSINTKQTNITKIISDFSIDKLLSFTTSYTLNELTIENIDYLTYFNNIEAINWVIMLKTPKNTAYSLSNNLLFSLSLTIFIQLIVIIAVISTILAIEFKPLKELTLMLETLTNSLKNKTTKADLSMRFNVKRKDEIGKLSTSINVFIEVLEKVIGDLIDTSADIKKDSNNSIHEAEKTLDSLTGQLNEVEQVVTALEEMSSTAAEIAQNTEETTTAVKISTDACSEGKEVIQCNKNAIIALSNQIESATQIVKQLEKNATEINLILATIQAIAEQTNLLALNAAIEAARAGESGKGFAVVADEVRVLSQRTHSSTEEIKSMLEMLQSNAMQAVEEMDQSKSKVEKGVKTAQDATLTFDNISEKILQIYDVTTLISTAAEEQRAVTEDVARNTLSIKNMSDNLVEQTTQNKTISSKMQKISLDLSEKVNHFKVGKKN